MMSCNAPSSLELSRGHFGKCQSILQEIIWMINNWESSLQHFNITKREDEIINCENALLKVKDMIWTSCLALYSKYDPKPKQPKGTQNASMYVQPKIMGTKTVNHNTEVVTHERNNVSVAVHKHEANHMVVASDSHNQRIVKNLLFDWSVFVNPQFQLCLVGSLPNGGKWETSPIAVRLGPNTVKTISGTMYAMSGKMVVREGIDVPDFVQDKFQDGFPMHWKSIASKWISNLKEQKCGLSGPGVSSENAVSVPFVVLNDVGKQQAVIPIQFSPQSGKFGEPMPMEDARRESLPIGNTKSQPSTSDSRSSSVLKPSENQQDESSEEEEEEVQGVAVMPRYSRRLLSRSFIATTCLSDGEVSPNKNVKEEKFQYLKNWTVDLSRKKDKLVLFGTLIDEKGNVLQENHYSPPIAHRIQADIVRMEKGNHYRLVGLSASKSRYFDFGFPISWWNFFRKLNGETLCGRPSMKASMGAQNKLGTSNVGKRAVNSVTLHSRNGGPIKRRKVSDEDPDHKKLRDQNDRVLSELTQPKESERIPPKPTKTVKPVRKNNDKFSLGLATDDC